MANFGGGRSGSSRTRKGIWAAVVLAGTLSVMLLFSAQRQVRKHSCCNALPYSSGHEACLHVLASN